VKKLPNPRRRIAPKVLLPGVGVEVGIIDSLCQK
jgi:hypothetical protein